jgi:hypothetical protein
MERCIEAWRDQVFDLLLREEKIDEEVVRSMRGWPHSGFSIDNSVQIGSEDEEGMQRLVSYISRCPFSLARMIKITKEGQVIYRAGKSECVRFPRPGDEQLREGVSRNFQVFDALVSLPSSCLAMGGGDAAYTGQGAAPDSLLKLVFE